jgi:hypothetical protein
MEIDEIYISLIVRQLKKEASGIEKKKLFEWIYSNPEHEKIYYLLKDIWETSRYEQIAGEAMTDSEWEKLALKAIETESGHYIKKQKISEGCIVPYRLRLSWFLPLDWVFFLTECFPTNKSL